MLDNIFRECFSSPLIDSGAARKFVDRVIIVYPNKTITRPSACRSIEALCPTFSATHPSHYNFYQCLSPETQGHVDLPYVCLSLLRFSLRPKPLAYHHNNPMITLLGSSLAPQYDLSSFIPWTACHEVIHTRGTSAELHSCSLHLPRTVFFL